MYLRSPNEFKRVFRITANISVEERGMYAIAAVTRQREESPHLAGSGVSAI
jgi:hypothetical protein